MSNTEYVLERIAVALESIAHSLNQGTSEKQRTEGGNIVTSYSPVLEEALMSRTIEVYLQEALRKKSERLKRKSARKVSADLISMQIDFLTELLPSCTIRDIGGGILLISTGEIPNALIRIYTDLGFHRGHHFQTEVKKVVDVAKQVNVLPEKVFLIVLSAYNGLDNSHVQQLLDEPISNKELLEHENEAKLKAYWGKFIASLGGLLPNPSQQAHILAGSLHPNIVAEAVLKDSRVEIDLANYAWLDTPLKKIVEKIKAL